MKWLLTKIWRLPWPARAERKAAILRAQQGTRESRRQADHSRRITEDLHRMHDDKVADSIVRGLMGERQ